MEYYSDTDCPNQKLEHDNDGLTAYYTDDEDTIHDDQFDVLSFLSVITGPDETRKDWPGLVFLSIHLGPWNMFLPFLPYSGAYFSVTLVPSKYFLRQTAAKMDPWYSISDFVALKTPRLVQAQKSRENSSLFRSITKEYQILKSELLMNHENIVTIYGCCWQSLDVYNGLPIPSLILEGTKFGDLVNFSRTRELTMRERLRICMHITSGLQAIHAIDVVHGDLKPENVLVFHSTGQGYTAKIADFGSALLLGETALPSRRPVGTVFYSAPECYDKTATFGRDELFKIDIFSLGITLASLIQGMHVLDKMKASSASRLELLKKSGKLPDLLTEPSCQDLEDAVLQGGSGKYQDEDAWVTDLGWYDNSILADEHLWIVYLQLVRGSLAASAGQRFGSVEDIMSILRTMLQLHLRRIFKHREGTPRPEKNADPEWWAHISKVSRMSKARLRKVTGARVGLPSRLNKEEVVALSLCCECGGSFLREARFIHKNTANKEHQSSRQLKKMRIGLPSSMLSKRRTSPMSEGVMHWIKKMVELKISRIRRQLEHPTQLKMVGLEKGIFKATRNSNIFWLLPYAVKELVENQLLQGAMNKSTSEAHRVDAAYEYAAMVLNSEELSSTKLAKALEILTLSAQNGHLQAQYSVGRLSDSFGYPLPVSREVEIGWLHAASEAGSMTAQRRFQELEPERFAQARRNIRQRYGWWCPKLNEILFEECQRIKNLGSFPDVLFAHLYECAITGNLQSLRKLPKCRKEVYDCQNVLGETPLVIACRGGHAAVATHLLACGADPTIATKAIVTPLHFLSAFDDEDVPKMASLLLQQGAELEKFCKSALIYKELDDSSFGLFEGTPLLWAVAARNRCATRALVDRGANPFITAKPSGTFDESIVSWPIILAAMLHQHDLLEMMLPRAQNGTWDSDCQRDLSNPYKHRAGWCATALSLAIDCNPGLRLREYLIHGNCFKRAALKCVQILIEFGADPMVTTTDWNGQNQHVILNACISGNISTITYLWNYQNGSLRPTPYVWKTSLSMAVFHRNHAVFDFLIEHRGDLAPDLDIDVQAIEKVLLLTNNSDMVLGVLKLILQAKANYRPSHYEHLFHGAVAAGQFEAAKCIFQKARLSLTTRVDGATFLGNLISVSSYPNMKQKFLFILSLPREKDSLFWNVKYLGGSGLTALQAIVYALTDTVRMNATIFQIILEYFEEPKYLNAQMQGQPHWKFTGYSALHLAAQLGNTEAAESLLGKTGIEPNLRNSRGETPMDICIALEENFARQQNATEFQPDEPLINKRRQANKMIVGKLGSAGGRIAKFSTVIIRSTQDSFIVLDRVMGNTRDIDLLDMIESNSAVTKPSRDLVAYVPVEGLKAFVDEPSTANPNLPSDLRDCILSLSSI